MHLFFPQRLRRILSRRCVRRTSSTMSEPMSGRSFAWCAFSLSPLCHCTMGFQRPQNSVLMHHGPECDIEQPAEHTARHLRKV